MTLDEAIEQFKYDAECNRADLDLSYAEDNEQIAEWLEDYKQIKMLIPIEQALKAEYNKAIDDFAEKMKYKYGSDEIHETIDEIAEQLKAGKNNENYNKEES